MSNDLCWISRITRQEHEQMLSRFSAYEIIFVTIRQLDLTLLTPNGTLRQQPHHSKSNNIKKQNVHKFSSCMLQIASKNNCVILVPRSNSAEYSDQMPYESHFYTSDNQFSQMMKNWSVFGESKVCLNKKLRIEVYRWGNYFQFQFLQGENNQILMIIRDLTSVGDNNINEQTNGIKKYSERFRDIFAIFGCLYYEHPFFKKTQQQSSNQNQADHQQNREREHNRENREVSSIVKEFDAKLLIFRQKYKRFINETFEDHKNLNHLFRLASIAEFAFKNRQNPQLNSNPMQKRESQI